MDGRTIQFLVTILAYEIIMYIHIFWKIGPIEYGKNKDKKVKKFCMTSVMRPEEPFHLLISWQMCSHVNRYTVKRCKFVQKQHVRLIFPSEPLRSMLISILRVNSSLLLFHKDVELSLSLSLC